MIEYEAIRLREIAMLDQLEAHLLEMAAEGKYSRRAIERRLHKLASVRRLWEAPRAQRRVSTHG